MTAKAYLIVQVEVSDPEGYETYRKGTPPIVERFGGRFLVRGGTLHPLEGDPGAGRLVIVEFPNANAAESFYRSPEYQALVPHRTANASGSLFIAEGVTS